MDSLEWVRGKGEGRGEWIKMGFDEEKDRQRKKKEWKVRLKEARNKTVATKQTQKEWFLNPKFTYFQWEIQKENGNWRKKSWDIFDFWKKNIKKRSPFV